MPHFSNHTPCCLSDFLEITATFTKNHYKYDLQSFLLFGAHIALLLSTDAPSPWEGQDYYIRFITKSLNNHFPRSLTSE